MLVRVAKKTVEALDVVSLELRGESQLPRFSAGAHIDIEVEPGLVRQYSLCNHPLEDDRYVVAILREAKSRGGSRAVHDSIRISDVVKISEPRNNFPLVPAQKVLLFAGGIGITPIICMADWLHHVGVGFDLHYCTRSVERTAFRSRLMDAPYAAHVQFHHDEGEESQRLNLGDALRGTLEDKHLYVCGPTGFMEAVLARARAEGWPETHLHREYFSAAPQSALDAEFQVQLASDGRVFTIPANESVVTVLARHGVHIPVSCELGVCGTCLTRIRDGVPDHRDVYLTDEERGRNDRFTPCCSRAKSPILVLER